MNEKLKSILHHAWNEPRRFFFWLAVVAIGGFGVVALASALAGPNFPLAFVALGCIACVAVSVPAFILAWIPPVRRLFAWLLRRRFLVLGCLAALVALCYAVENWRGRAAWRDFRRPREAKGERYDLASFVPAPVPDDQNFFATPLWNDLRSAATNRATSWIDYREREDAPPFNVYSTNGVNGPGEISGWVTGQRVDLAAWQGFYRGRSNEVALAKSVPSTAAESAAQQAAIAAFRRRYGLDAAGVRPELSSPPTNYFPVAAQAQSPAVDVLLALSRFDANRQLLIAAAARPQARAWINYEAGFAKLLPHLAPMKGMAQYLALHAAAALKAGDRDAALEEVKLSFRLLQTMRPEPVLLSHLVRIAVLQVVLQPIWEGLADRQWTEPDLTLLESELGKLDFVADYKFAMRGERAYNLWGVDYFHRMGIELGPQPPEGSPGLGDFMGRTVFKLIPAGWFDQSKISLCRAHEQYVPVLTAENNMMTPAAVRRANAAIEKLQLRPYDMFSRLLLPAFGSFAEKCARAQVSADLVRIACALERYRLANSQFPETLEALVPKFIEPLPHDLINGQPLKYLRSADGQFVLYSVGWNEKDDGGTLGLKRSGALDPDNGDWVWQYPPRA